MSQFSVVYSILVHWLVILLLSPIFFGVISRVKAFFAGKRGPSVFQPYFDLIKLFRKRCVYSRATTWVSRAAPCVVFAAVLAAALILPFGMLKAPVRFSGDIILAVYLLALARFFMIIAALDTGSSFEGMGASREAFFSCLSELSLFMNFITLALLAHNSSLSHMIGADIPMSWITIGPALLLVVASVFILLLAENCRIPVDDPQTHLELTMIHEVMILDYSGPDLAFVLYAASLKLWVFGALIVSVLLSALGLEGMAAIGGFYAGMVVLAVLVGVIESTMARLSLLKVPQMLVGAGALSVLAFTLVVRFTS